MDLPARQNNPNQQQPKQQEIEYQSNDITQSRPNIIRSNRNGNKRTATAASLPDNVVPKPITLVLIKTLLPSDVHH
jgi:hypothetical protein